MSSTRWYLNNTDGLTYRDGEHWFANAVSVRNFGTDLPKVEVKMATPLSPSLLGMSALIQQLDLASKLVSFQGTASRLKLLQGEYELASARGLVKVLREGDYLVEICATAFSDVQTMYRAMMEGEIKPAIVWRGVDTTQAA